MEVSSREVPIRTYGRIDCGGELMREAWKGLEHTFAVRRHKESINLAILYDMPPLPSKIFTPSGFIGGGQRNRHFTTR